MTLIRGSWDRRAGVQRRKELMRAQVNHAFRRGGMGGALGMFEQAGGFTGGKSFIRGVAGGCGGKGRRDLKRGRLQTGDWERGVALNQRQKSLAEILTGSRIVQNGGPGR